MAFIAQYSSTLKRVKFVDEEMVQGSSKGGQQGAGVGAGHAAQYVGGKIHLCPMHKHKLAISATNLYNSEAVKHSRLEGTSQNNTLLQTFTEVELSL